MSSKAAVVEKMYYRVLGNTGIQVSVLSYGFWATFGVKSGLEKQAGIDAAKDILRVARINGVNLFDNAETYGNPTGEAERIMGEAITQLRKEDEKLWRRSDILITTKLYWGGAGVNESGLSRKHIQEGMTRSLKNLQTDYVDMILAHRPDALTPTETVVQSMTELIKQGKAMSWGTSEWSAQQITEAFWIAKTQGLIAPQYEQPQYNMLHRERFEKEYGPLYGGPYNLGTTIWSPLKSGILTGKYNDGIPTGSRLQQPGYEYLQGTLQKLVKDGSIEKIKQLTALAKERFNCSVSQLAVAWCVKNKNVTTVLLGATSTQQLEDNLASLNIVKSITDKDMADIEAILENKPEGWTGLGGMLHRDFDTI